MVRADYIRVQNGRYVLDGAFGVTYNVDTVESIDANLDSMRFRPGHPDIDRLLDARRIIGPLRVIIPPATDWA